MATTTEHDALLAALEADGHDVDEYRDDPSMLRGYADAIGYRRPLTGRDFDRATNDDRWLGFGYLGGRLHMLTEDRDWVDRVDAELAAYANERGWTYEQLFAWANSRNGRHAADALYSGEPLSKVVAWDLMALPRD